MVRLDVDIMYSSESTSGSVSLQGLAPAHLAVDTNGADWHVHALFNCFMRQPLDHTFANLAENEAVHQKLDQTYPNILGEF